MFCLRLRSPKPCMVRSPKPDVDCHRPTCPGGDARPVEVRVCLVAPWTISKTSLGPRPLSEWAHKAHFRS